MSFPSRLGHQHQLFEGKPVVGRAFRARAKEFDNLNLTRLSANFILRDFMYSTESALLGLANRPEDMEMVIKASKALCEKILEPVLAHFGRFWITFAYQCREAIEAGMPESARHTNPHSSNPHQFDRKTWGNEVYARIDFWPICVEDGLVSKAEFGHWLMHNLDVDLLMQWSRSNIFCITISPQPRRVWVEWGDAKKGQPHQRVIMGADYWQNVYPSLPKHERPKFAPSCTGGRMQWQGAR